MAKNKRLGALVLALIAVSSVTIYRNSPSEDSDCLVRMHNNKDICYKAAYRNGSAERTALESLSDWQPSFDRSPNPDYPQLLRDALWLDPAPYSHERKEVSDWLSDNRVRYSDLPFDNYYLSATQGSRRAIIVVHGHSSSRWKIMGMEAQDYTQDIGRWFYDVGFDVFAVGSISEARKAELVRRHLEVIGKPLYGVWIRFVCDLRERLASEYDEVWLYGISNGGKIANYTSVLCAGFHRVIVDDHLVDSRDHVLSKGFESWPKGYMYSFDRGFLSVDSLANKVSFLRNPTTFIVRESVLDQIKALGIEPDADFAIKATEYHIPERDVLAGILGE